MRGYGVFSHNALHWLMRECLLVDVYIAANDISTLKIFALPQVDDAFIAAFDLSI